MALADILFPFLCVCLFPWLLGGRVSLLEAGLRGGTCSDPQAGMAAGI